MCYKKIKALAERLAEFDFSTLITLRRRDEFGQTGKALNQSIENVKSLIKLIIENSQDMSASGEELSATVQELTSKAEEIDNSVSDITFEGTGNQYYYLDYTLIRWFN